MSKRVAILGGGVAGMSAAHELLERGFEVVVYEKNGIPGGKARSMPYPQSGVDGRKDLPGEHGFRFFPGFYWHLPDTMKRIPFGKEGGTVLDNLVATSCTLIGHAGRQPLRTPVHFPQNLEEVAQAFDVLREVGTSVAIPLDQIEVFISRLLVLLLSCEQRRQGNERMPGYDDISWFDFAKVDGKSADYRTYFAIGLSRSLVAMAAERASTLTCGYTLLQLLFDFAEPGKQVDRVLNGPTNDVWIQPWLEHLRRMGGEYHTEVEVARLECVGNRITGVIVTDRHGSPSRVVADYYIAAVPVEVMRRLVNSTPVLKDADPTLAGLEHLETSWMNGILLYLDQDVPLVRGHALFIDSPWALSSISQKQFWPDANIKLEDYGNGRVKGIFSVIISDWLTTRGTNGLFARQCSRDEIEKEVREQLRARIDEDAGRRLAAQGPVEPFLDPALVFTAGAHGVQENQEPLLVNTAGSLKFRPAAVLGGIDNLFLASDYVRTNTSLATMEGANEAARRAVNGILDAVNGALDPAAPKLPPCEVRPLHEPVVLAPFHELDRILFARGLPTLPDLFPGRPVEEVLRLGDNLLRLGHEGIRTVLDTLPRLDPELLPHLADRLLKPPPDASGTLDGLRLSQLIDNLPRVSPSTLPLPGLGDFQPPHLP